mgnify:FL=1
MCSVHNQTSFIQTYLSVGLSACWEKNHYQQTTNRNKRNNGHTESLSQANNRLKNKSEHYEQVREQKKAMHGFTFWVVLDQVSMERDLLPDSGVHSSCSTAVNENFISSIYMKLEKKYEVLA